MKLEDAALICRPLRDLHDWENERAMKEDRYRDTLREQFLTDKDNFELLMEHIYNDAGKYHEYKRAKQFTAALHAFVNAKKDDKQALITLFNVINDAATDLAWKQPLPGEE